MGFGLPGSLPSCMLLLSTMYISSLANKIVAVVAVAVNIWAAESEHVSGPLGL